MRKESLDSTYYEDFEQFTAAIDQCLDELAHRAQGRDGNADDAQVPDV